MMAAKRAQSQQFAQAFHPTHSLPGGVVGETLPAPQLPKDVETGFLNTIIQRANAGTPPAAMPVGALSAPRAAPSAATPAGGVAVRTGVGGEGVAVHRG